MPYLAGVLTGVLLTILVVFLVDNLAVTNATSGIEPQKIVNWNVAAQKLRSSITTVNKEVHELREDVHVRPSFPAVPANSTPQAEFCA